MRAKDRFHKALKTTVIPTLRALGFSGSHPTFRRHEGPVVIIVNIQASSGGDGCYVNLGAAHRALKQPKTNWKELREYECPFRARLWNVAGQDFFAYGTSDESAALQADGLSEMLKTEGSFWMGQFEPDALADTVKRVAKEGVKSFVPYGWCAPAETFARLAKALGDAASERALVKQAERHERERAKERAREAKTAIAMTFEEFRAAKKLGTIPAGATIRIVGSPKKKASAVTRSRSAASASRPESRRRSTR